MKAKTRLLMLTMFISLTYSCSDAQSAAPDEIKAKGSKTLIVYLSRTGNTKAVAEMIQSHVGGKLVALELDKPYPKDYQTAVNQVAAENNTGFLPVLKTKIDSMETFNTIFIGFPTWGMQLPPPIKSFLSDYDFTGKTIIPFNTNAGYGIGSSFDQVKNLSPNSTVLQGISFTGGKERDKIYFVMEGRKKMTTNAELSKWLLRLDFKHLTK
jgi:flavodoxin